MVLLQKLEATQPTIFPMVPPGKSPLAEQRTRAPLVQDGDEKNQNMRKVVSGDDQGSYAPVPVGLRRPCAGTFPSQPFKQYQHKPKQVVNKSDLHSKWSRMGGLVNQPTWW